MARESFEVQQSGPAFDGLDERQPDKRPVHQPVGDDVGQRPWLPQQLQQRLVAAATTAAKRSRAARTACRSSSTPTWCAVPVSAAPHVGESSDRRDEVVETAGEVAVVGTEGRQVDVSGERRTRRARPGGRSGRWCVRAGGAPLRTAARGRAPRRRRRCPPARDRSGRRSRAAAGGRRPRRQPPCRTRRGASRGRGRRRPPPGGRRPAPPGHVEPRDVVLAGMGHGDEPDVRVQSSAPADREGRGRPGRFPPSR